MAEKKNGLTGIPVDNIKESLIEKALNESDDKQSFDIDNWKQDFENGFLDYMGSVVNQSLKEGYFGQTADHRPRIIELNVEANARQVEGYRVIELLPDRENKDESYIFFGTPLELQSQICIFLNIWRLSKYTSGQNQNNSNIPMPRNKPIEGIFIKIYLASQKEPPFSKNTGKKSDTEYSTVRYVTIPAVDKSKVTYESLRSICGGTMGQKWGKWQARTYVKSPIGIHQIVCGGNTEKTAIENLQKFMLITAAIPFRPVTTSHDLRAKNAPKSFTLYPAYCEIEHYDEIKWTSKSTITDAELENLLKNRVIKKAHIDLYYSAPPKTVIEKIKNTLRITAKDRNNI